MVRTVVLGAGADLADAFVVEFIQRLTEGNRFHWI